MSRADLLNAQADDLDEAAQCIADWGAYASEYFQEKHDLKAQVELFKGKATALRAQAAATPEAEPSPALIAHIWHKAHNAWMTHSRHSTQEAGDLAAIAELTHWFAPPDLTARIAELEGLLRRWQARQFKEAQSDWHVNTDTIAALAKGAK